MISKVVWLTNKCHGHKANLCRASKLHSESHPFSRRRHDKPVLELLMTIGMLTRQAVHMTLPVPEQKGHISSPLFLAVVWITLTGTLPSPAQFAHVN